MKSTKEIFHAQVNKNMQPEEFDWSFSVAARVRQLLRGRLLEKENGSQ